MAGINYPLWRTLKINVVSILEAVAAEENAIDPGRNFAVTRDRWRPWIESQQGTALCNVMIQNVNKTPERSGSRRSYLDTVNVYIDMYAIGEAGQIEPADVVAADRLDLLTAQAREAITRLKEIDLGFNIDPDGGHIVDWDGSADMTIYDQDQEDTTGQYAPARWTFSVMMPYIPVDNHDFPNISELNLEPFKDELESFSLKFTYDTP